MRKAVKFLLEHANGALFLDPGMRKTSCTLAALKFLFDKGMVKRVLIIAPLRPCYDVWPGEIEKWADFNGITYTILHGAKKDEALKKSAQLYIINPDGLDWLLGATKTKFQALSKNKATQQAVVVQRTKIAVDVKAFKKLAFDALVIDELTQFKNDRSQRFRMLKEVLHTFRYRWGLTGSPSANGLLDLFGQCYVLDLGNALGRFITHYRNAYFQSDHSGFVWSPVPGGPEAIYERIAPLALRLDAKDYIELPEMVQQDILIDLPPKVQTVYDDLEDDLIAGITNHVIVATNAASASIKCRQVACGGIYHTDALIAGQAKKKREWTNLHNEKTDALKELFEGLQGSPLLVAYDFEHDVDRLREAFPKKSGAVFACDIHMRDFRDLVARWNAGSIPILFGHPQSIGHGLNLQGNGNHVCWHSPTWNFELYDQFNRRVLRSGNTAAHVFVHHIVARGTIEEIMIARLKAKDTDQQTLFTALQALAKKRKRK